MAKRYKMDAAEAKALRDSIQALDTSGRSPSPQPDNSKAADPAVRTKVPVQFLASTRRIAEFATAKQPKANDKIVYVSGSFDMFHVGHAQLLKEARELGTFLFVGVHDDQTVTRSKGANYPVMSLNERVLNVCACKWVDEVVI